MARGNGERARSGPRGVPALQVPDGPWCASTWPVVDIAGDLHPGAAHDPVDLTDVEKKPAQRGVVEHG